MFDDRLDLGKDDFSGKEDSFSDKFLSKPIQRQYQPFGGPRPQPSQPQYEMEQDPLPEYGYEVQPGQYEIPFSQEADMYDQAKKQYAYIKSDASALNSSANFSEGRYKDFFKNKFLPFYKELDPYGDFDNDEDFVNSLDSQYEADLKASRGGDEVAKSNLGKYFKWNQPNGLRDQYLRFKKERDDRRLVADQYRAQEIALRDQLTNIPPHVRVGLDEAKQKKALKPRSKKQTDDMLNQMRFEDALPDMLTGEVPNLHKTDPRKDPAPLPDMLTGEKSSASKQQEKRLAAAIRGDMDGFMSRRETVARDRQLRDKGFMFSSNGMMDGRPIGLPRSDVDLLDIDEMRSLGIKQYKGVPIEEAFQKLGGEERLNAAKILQAVRQAFNNSEDSQIEYLASGRTPELKNKMEADRAVLAKTMQLAAEFGLTDEMIEHNESKNFFVRLYENSKNAIARGFNMFQQSRYAEDMLTGTLSDSEMADLLEYVEEAENIPTGSAVKKFNAYQSKDLWDAAGNLLFENPEAMPELLAESLSAFLPSYLRTAPATIGTTTAGGAALGLAGGPLAPATVTSGALAGIKVGARINYGIAEAALEYSGVIIESMQELGIDYKNPKVFAAAWANEEIRDAIKTKAAKKSVPIALTGAAGGLLAGRVTAGLHHVGKSLKGGKLIDAAQWKRSQLTAPRFTRFQRVRNVGTELAVGDVALGGAGEYLGQLWSKDPGERIDYNAVAAEMTVGLGPGAFGAGVEMFRGKPDVSNVPTIIRGLKDTGVGTTGIIDLAGYRNEFNTFRDYRAAAQHIVDQGQFENDAKKQEALQIFTDVLARFHAANPDMASRLKLVFADRTPMADAKQEGSFHEWKVNEELAQDEHELAIFINRKAISGNPMGVFFHEGGHFARAAMDIDNERLLEMYRDLTEEQRLDALTQYVVKQPDATYANLDPKSAERKQVDALMSGPQSMTELTRADEWFSYQFVRVLTGRTLDSGNPNLKKDLQNHLRMNVYPIVKKYVGGMDLGGSTVENRLELDRDILNFMGYTPDGVKRGGKEVGLTFGEHQHERPGMKRFFEPGGKLVIDQMGDEEGLNHLMKGIAVLAESDAKTAKRVAEMVNKLIGQDLLPTKGKLSLYTENELKEAFDPLAQDAVYQEDAVQTAERYSELKGEDAQAAVDQLTETPQSVKIENLETELARANKELEKLQKAPAERRKEKEIEGQTRAKERIEGQIKELKSAPKTSAKQAKQPLRASGATQLEKLVEDTRGPLLRVSTLFRGATPKSLRTISDLRKKAQKQIEDGEAFEKSVTDAISKIQEAKTKQEDGQSLKSEEVSMAQIIAQMLGINELQQNALFTESRVADDLVDVVSAKEPDTNRVADAFLKYTNEVEGAIDALAVRESELRAKKQILQTPPKATKAEEKTEGETRSLGASWKVVRRLPSGQFLLWNGKKWAPTKLVSDKTPKEYLKKKLDKKYFATIAKKEKYKEALKSLKEDDRKFVSFWRDASTKSEPKKKTEAKKTQAKKTEAKPKKKTKAQKAIDQEIKEIDKKIKLIRQLREAIDPENAAVSVDWRDVPHFSYRYKNEKGEYVPLTLGQIADRSKLDEDDTPGVTIYRKNKKGEYKPYDLADANTHLWQYTDWRKAPKKEQKPKEEKKDDKPKAEAQKPKAEGQEEMAAPMQTMKKDLGNGKLFEIDSNGNGGIYVKKAGVYVLEQSATPDMIRQYLGKTKREVVKELKDNEGPFILGPDGEPIKYTPPKKPESKSDNKISEVEDPDIGQAFNPNKQGDKLDWWKPKDGDNSKKRYLLALDAARASAAYGKQIGNKPYPAPRKAGKAGDEVTQPKETGIYFQTEQPTTLAQLALFRLKMLDQKNKVTNRPLTSATVDSLRLAELTIYQNAMGRSFELLDDRNTNGVQVQRILNLVERRAAILEQDIRRIEKEVEEGASKQDMLDRMKRTLLNLIFDPFEQGAQAEETGGLFPQLNSGKTWTEALNDYLFYTEREEVMGKILDDWKAKIAQNQGTEKPTPKSYGFFDIISDDLLLRKLRNLNSGQAEFVTASDPDAVQTEEITKQLEGRVEEMTALREEFQAKLEQALAKRQSSLKKENLKRLKLVGKNGKPLNPDQYVFYKPQVNGDEEVRTVPKRKGERPFLRRNADEGIPVYQMFSDARRNNLSEDAEINKGSLGASELADPEMAFAIEQRIREEFTAKPPQGIVIEMPGSKKGSTVKVRREYSQANPEGIWKYDSTNRKIPESREAIADEAYDKYVLEGVQELDDQIREGLTSSNSVSPAQFANYIFSQLDKNKGNLTKIMNDLQFMPSSKVGKNNVTSEAKELKQLPGGLASGLLPYVWFDFIKKTYDLLGLDPESVNKASGGKWKYDGDTFIVNGKRTASAMFLTKAPDPKVMAETAIPVIQRIADAGRLAINESAEKTQAQSQLKQTDMQLFGSPIENELGDAPEGSFDNQDIESETTSGKVTQDDLNRERTDEEPEDFRESNKEFETEEIPFNLGKPRRTAYSDKLLKEKARKEKESGEKAAPVEDPALAARGPLTYVGKPAPKTKAEKKEDLRARRDAKRAAKKAAETKQKPEPKTEPKTESKTEQKTGLDPLTEDSAEWKEYVKTGEVTEERMRDIVRKSIVDRESVSAIETQIFNDKADLRNKILEEFQNDPRSLGSTYSLSSHAPDVDLNEHISLFSRMASSDRAKDWKELWESIKSKLPGLKAGAISSFVNIADASSRVVEKFARDAGINDQVLLDKLDIRGLWHQYYGKTDEVVKQAQLRFIEPIEDALRKHGISLDDWGRYLLARAAPSRNIRLKKMYQEELAGTDKESEVEALTKLLEKHGDNLSGIHTDDAIIEVQGMEADENFKKFLDDPVNPLQLFYDMNIEGLKFKSDSGLIRSTEGEGKNPDFPSDIDEYDAMVKASSSFDWSKNGSRYTFLDGDGNPSNYSYAPMQGFEGETDGRLFDREAAFQVMGKSSTSAGKGWDQPKHKFIQLGAFGRFKKDGSSKTTITDENGNKQAVGPDPRLTFMTAQEQYFDGAIRSHKNDVSQAYGQAFEIMRAVAYPNENLETMEGAPTFDLKSQMPDLWARMQKDETISQKAREMFEGDNAVFEKEFRALKEKQDYEIETKDIEVNGKKVDGLSMVRRSIDKTYQNMADVFVYRKNGVAHLIKFKNNERGSRVARSLKNLRYEPLPKVLQAPNSITRFMASMFTSKNPLFWLPNFSRDLGTMAIHLTEDDKSELLKDAFNLKTLGGFIRGVIKNEMDMKKGKITALPRFSKSDMTQDFAQQLLKEGDYSKMYQFAKQAGGKVGYFRHKPIAELIEDFKKSAKKANKSEGFVKKRWKALWDYVDAGSSAFENSVRMAAFWSAIKNGRTVHQAANISRNITVDFNQKGELSQILGSQFVFFSAGVNSADRMIKTFQRRGVKGSAKFVAKLAGASFLLATLNRMMDDEEEEKATTDFDTLSSYKRDTNAVVQLPDGNGSVTIPVPLGYNAIWALGNTLADAFWDTFSDGDTISTAEFLSRNGSATMNALNPIGGVNISNILTPSWAKPIQEVFVTEEDFLGRPNLKPNLPFEAPKPTHMRAQERDHQYLVDADKKLNEWMGGNDQVTGSWAGFFGGDAAKSRDGKKSLSLMEVEQIVTGYTGGLGQLFSGTFGEGIYPLISDTKEFEKPEWNKVPLMNRFYRTTAHDSYLRQKYYHTRQVVKTAEAEVKAAGKNKALANQIQADRKDLLSLSATVKFVDGLRSKIRAEKRKIENSKLSAEQKMQRIAKLEAKEQDALRTAVKKAQKRDIV